MILCFHNIQTPRTISVIWKYWRLLYSFKSNRHQHLFASFRGQTWICPFRHNWTQLLSFNRARDMFPAALAKRAASISYFTRYLIHQHSHLGLDMTALPHWNQMLYYERRKEVKWTRVKYFNVFHSPHPHWI